MVTFKETNSMNSPILQPSRLILDKQPRLSHISEDSPQLPLVLTPRQSLGIPLDQSQLSNSHRQRLSSLSIGRKVAEEVESEGLIKTKVCYSDGRFFDREAYLSDSIKRSKRIAKHYQDEINQVTLVTEELQRLVEKTAALKKELTEKREHLLQKKYEVRDIEFIRETRYKELGKMKQALCQSILDSEKDSGKGYLASSRSLNSVQIPDGELLKMKCAVYMSNRSDPEVDMLLLRYYYLLSSLGTGNSC